MSRLMSKHKPASVHPKHQLLGTGILVLLGLGVAFGSTTPSLPSSLRSFFLNVFMGPTFPMNKDISRITVDGPLYSS